MSIENLKPISPDTPDVFTGYMLFPQGGGIRYPGLERVKGYGEYVFRWMCPDGVYLYVSKGTVTHWSEA